METKKIKLLKKILSLTLVLFLCIESFAAVVSDNDGSAFITKAEFDSLKNSFQSQIDQYNTSLDSKIDGAIAAYLAGIRMAKKTDVSILVDNYNDIIWKRRFDFYGSYADWTNKTTRSVNSNVWYIPQFQKYFTQRGSSGTNNVFAVSRFSYGALLSLQFNYNFPSLSGVAAFENDFAQTSGAPLPLIFQCKYNEDDTADIEIRSDTSPLKLFICYDSYNGVNMKVGPNAYIYRNGNWNTEAPNSWNGISPVLEDNSMSLPVIEPLAKEYDDEVVGFWAYMNYNGNRGQWLRFGGHWRVTEFAPMTIQWREPSSGTDQLDKSWPNWPVAPDVFSLNGNHLYGQVFDGTQNNMVRYLLAGSDWNQMVNITRESTLKAGRTNQIKTTYSDWASVPVKITSVTAGGLYPWTYDTTTSRTGLDIELSSYRLPYAERYELKNITSGLFKYNDKKLKIGDGLPISTYLNGSGNLTINFDYSIGRTAQSVSSTEDKRIKVDVKKSSFLSGADDYYSGIVDDGTTVVTLKDVSSGSDTSQKSKIVIENVKEGDQVWIRIAPYSTTPGLYAKMSNLASQVESED